MKRVMLAAVLALSAGTSAADKLDQIGTLSQTNFTEISKDLVAAFSYKAGSPAEALGITGFDVGLAVSSTKLKYTSAWTAAMSTGKTMDTLVVPKLYIQKGLPFDVDVGAYYLSVPNSNIDAWGAELKYAIISGNVALPAVAVRAAVTTLNVDNQLDLTTRSLDVSISKSVLFLTPYAGVGRVWGDSRPMGTTPVANAVTVSETKSFVGLSIQPGFFNLALERDSVGGIASYNMKLGVAF